MEMSSQTLPKSGLPTLETASIDGTGKTITLKWQGLMDESVPDATGKKIEKFVREIQS
ncbi:MAG: hypothetical protein KME06_11905 [Kastovskya adunca ATA6-11-RM4]|jgi:hypothetical protein|nr:hypothetical protein [Kastovskya adunca ATA6-11-RM4]